MSNRIAIGVCAGLLILFYAISYAAVCSKCATVDEPLHAVGAYTSVTEHDFRINPEDPPLWNYWAMLPHHRGELNVNYNSPAWRDMTRTPGLAASFVTGTLFQTRGNDGAAFIHRSRAMMLLIGVMLGGLLAGFTWKLAGPVAAIIATALFCFDPNFLAHAPLVKNDVAISFLMLALAAVLWSVGRGVTWWNVPLLGVIIGAGMSVKFSGVLFVPIVAVAMITREVLPHPWPLFGRAVARTEGKMLISAGVIGLSLFISWGVIWSSYRFRFEPTPAPGALLPLDNEVRAAARNLLFLKNGQRPPTTQEIDQWQPTLLVRAVLFAQDHRLLPQAWLYGFMMTYEGTLVRTSYLLGERGVTGWWYYFPLAMLFKTPLATLAAFGAAMMLSFKRESSGAAAVPRTLDRWTLLCLLIPVLIYAASALSTNLNLGLRHVLPLYPFLYILVAIGMTRLLSTFPRVARPILITLGVGLVVETMIAFPDYIAFFNAPSKSGRLYLLSDSNLDWGQDLPALAAWQKEHRGETLYLSYFGAVDPQFYKINYINMPAGFWMGPPPRWPGGMEPCVVAVSASRLQGNDMPEGLEDAYRVLREQRPIAVLGGSIYLCQWPPAR